jgi:hypothetical protein
VSVRDVAARPRFVVQLHDVTTPYFDFRLHGDVPGTGSRVRHRPPELRLPLASHAGGWSNQWV